MSSPALRQLARELAPLIAEELGLPYRGHANRQGKPAPIAGCRYDAAACQALLSPLHLGDSVLLRAKMFFHLLAQRSRVNSPEVVDALDLKGPTSIPANLTNPLKKGAARLDRPLPWREEADRENRTVWVDQKGNARRFVAAIEEEIISRGLG